MEATLEEGLAIPNIKEPAQPPPVISEIDEMPDMEQVLREKFSFSFPIANANPVDLVEILSSPAQPPVPHEIESSIDNAVYDSIRRINLIELEPTDLMVIHMSFKPVSPVYEALIDTGGLINLIADSVTTDLNLEVLPTAINLRGLGQGRQDSVGKVYLTPVLHGRMFPAACFYVVPSQTIPESVILGCEFFLENKIVVDTFHNCLRILDPSGKGHWEYYAKHGSHPCRQVFYGMDVVVENSVELFSSEPFPVPVAINFPEGVDPQYSCSSCIKEEVELFYDGYIDSKTLYNKVSGVPGIMLPSSHPFVLVTTYNPNRKACLSKERRNYR